MIATIGYEKADLNHFIGTLQKAGVEILVDVRERAQSRRKGFSKTALSEHLAKAGIGYVHYRQLGDPKAGREAAKQGDFVTFRRIYSTVLESDEAKTAMQELSVLSRSKSICLMCYERNHKDCHRKMISDKLDYLMGTKTRHLGVQAIEPISKTIRPMLHRNQGAAA